MPGLPDGLLAQILRHQPRVAQLRMRLASQRCCARITALASAGTLIWGRVAGFEPMFRMPAEVELDSVFAEFFVPVRPLPPLRRRRSEPLCSASTFLTYAVRSLPTRTTNSMTKSSL